LAQPSQDDDRTALESQIRECYGRSAYSHKTHERMADRLAARLRSIKWVQIILATLTTCGALGVVFAKDGTYYAYATVGLSFASLVLNSYMKDLDPGEAAQKHRETAADLWNIRESYLSLLTDIHQATPMPELKDRRDVLQESLHKVYRSAPHTDGMAYIKAQERLKNKEDLTFSDQEIDLLLPTTLRRKPPA
jgi:hypothetical protein